MTRKATTSSLKFSAAAFSSTTTPVCALARVLPFQSWRTPAAATQAQMRAGRVMLGPQRQRRGTCAGSTGWCAQSA